MIFESLFKNYKIIGTLSVESLVEIKPLVQYVKSLIQICKSLFRSIYQIIGRKPLLQHVKPLVET